MLNQKVIYNNKKYLVKYEYTTGFCELREEGNYYKIELVHKSEFKSVFLFLIGFICYLYWFDKFACTLQ